ncbi:unnamed protein product [Candidula unifasciata]|uniref:G patch domain-containing protein 4 n=1 Tax=Candidula unifasciata TaxID=100452 RepID=A0A8S3ZZU1_9EUPU|nr:unnamed protein product [Candidula unifasciata]
MAASEFAKRQLEKHGWTEGSGLGRQENGRSDPIKVTLKMDKTGVGHDPAKEFTDHWWLRVFNEAAQKIGKKQKDDTNSKSDGGKNKNQGTDMKNNFYKGFVKSATLTDGIEEKHKQSDSSNEDSSDEDSTTSSLPTLNDIHTFCGGATGHKAARFGIKMGGKLARIAIHEKMFEEQLKTKKLFEAVQETDSCGSNHLQDKEEGMPSPISIGSVPESSIASGNGRDKKKKKKHKKNSKDEDSICNSQPLDGELINGQEIIVAGDNELSQTVCKKSKKRKHKNKSKDECLKESISNSQYFNKELTSGPEIIVDSELSQTVCKKSKKRKHKKSKDEYPENALSNSQYLNKELISGTEKMVAVDSELSQTVCKKGKKRKHKKKSKDECPENALSNSQCLDEDLISGLEIIVAVNEELSKSICKKHKRKQKRYASDDERVATQASDLSHANKDQKDSDKVRDKKRKRQHAAEEEGIGENNLAEIKIKRKKKNTKDNICELEESDNKIKKKRKKNKM